MLVTGAAGFIGSTLTERLLAEGRRVVGLDSFDPFYPESHKQANLAAALRSDRFALVRADLRDAAALRRVFADERFDAVVHLAALAGVRPSLERPAEYADVNVRGTARAARGGRARGRAARRVRVVVVRVRRAQRRPVPRERSGRAAGLALRRHQARGRAASPTPSITRGASR